MNPPGPLGFFTPRLCKPPKPAPVQPMISGCAPIMPPGKIRPDTYPDPVDFAEGFTATPETLPLFSQEDKKP